MTAVIATILLSVILAAPAPAQDSETKIKMNDLPPAVQKAVKEQSMGATIIGFAREVDGGVTRYEAEMKVGDRTKDVTFDADGNVVTVEKETTLASIPAPSREAIKKAVGNRKLLLIETVEEKGSTFYEAHFRSGLRTREVKVDAAGNPVK